MPGTQGPGHESTLVQEGLHTSSERDGVETKKSLVVYILGGVVTLLALHPMHFMVSYRCCFSGGGRGREDDVGYSQNYFLGPSTYRRQHPIRM